MTTPLSLTLTLPPPDYARKGGEIIAAELAEVGIKAKIENVEWAQWLSECLQGQELRSDDHQPRRAARHRHLRQARLLLQLRQRRLQRDHRAAESTAPDIDAYKKALVDAQHKLADDSVNAFLFQLPNVVIADAKLKGLWKGAPIFANDRRRPLLEMNAARSGRRSAA